VTQMILPNPCSLFTFIDWCRPKTPDEVALFIPRNTYVDEPGFLTLYVRLTKRFVQGRWYLPVLDIANVEVAKKNKGTFTALIASIQQRYPRLHIYVENVLNPRFTAKLLRMGFTDVGPEWISTSKCFFLPAKESTDE
jgi:hypothetical protein